MRAGDPFCGMHAALISDQLKDPKLRDQQLAEIAARQGGWARISPARPHNEIVALAAMFVADLGRKPTAIWTSKRSTICWKNPLKWSGSTVATSWANICALRGKPELAIEPWLQCMPLLPMRAINRTLAAMRCLRPA